MNITVECLQQIKDIQAELDQEGLYSIVTGSLARHLNGIECSVSDCDLMFKDRDAMIQASECLKAKGYDTTKQSDREIVMSSDITLDLSYDNYHILSMEFITHEHDGLRYLDTHGLLWLSLLDLQGMHYVGYEYPANEKALRELTAHAKKLNLSCSDEMEEPSMKVALVNLPFAPHNSASLQLGIYKSILNELNIESDSFYLNRELSTLLHDSQFVEKFRHTYLFEWLFARKTWDKKQANDDQSYFLRCDNRTLYDGLRCKIEHLVDSWVTDINWSQYNIIVFPCSDQIIAALCLGKYIKERYPELLLCYSGTDVFEDAAKEYMAKVSWMDIIFVGEIENSFRQVMDNIEHDRDISQIQGIVHRNRQDVISTGAGRLDDINNSPCPDYRDFFEIVPQNEEVVIPYEASRGCWYGERKHCKFCSIDDIQFRCKDPDIVYKDICGIYGRWPDHNIRIDFTDMILEKSYLNTLLPRFASKSFKMFFEVKPDLNAHEIKTLHEAGVDKIQPGIENFDPNLIKLQDKGVSIAQSISLLKWCKFYNIEVFFNIICSIPHERAEWIDKQMEILRRTCHLSIPYLTQLVILRFSPYHSDGELDLQPSHAYQFIYPPEISTKTVASSFDYDLSLTCQEYIPKIKNLLASLRGQTSRTLRFIKPHKILDKRQSRIVHNISESQRMLIKDCTEPRLKKELSYSKQDMDDLIHVDILLEIEGKILSLVEVEEGDLQFCKPKPEYRQSISLKNEQSENIRIY